MDCYVFVARRSRACVGGPIRWTAVLTCSTLFEGTGRSQRQCAFAALAAYGGFRAKLAHDTDTALASYNDLVKLPPRAANVTITLP
mgnify:CR=1 FL=1